MEVTAPQVQTVDLAGNLQIYEKVWSAAGSAANITMPSGFQDALLIKSVANRQKKVTELLHNFSGLFHADRKWLVSNMETAEARLSGLEILELSGFPDLKQLASQGLAELASLKEEVKPVLSGFPSIQQYVAHHSTELNDIFINLSEFQKNFTDKLMALTRTVDQLERDAVSRGSSTLVGYIDELNTTIANLQKEQVSNHLHIESFESRISSRQEEITVGRLKICSPGNLVALLKNLGADSIDFGGLLMFTTSSSGYILGPRERLQWKIISNIKRISNP